MVTRSSAPPGQATLQLLGWWDLRRGDDSIVLGRREQRLVALLALSGRRTRDQVAGVLWPDSSEHHALSNLRAAVWNTRRSAGDVLLAQQHTLALARDLTVDVTQLVGLATGVTSEPGTLYSPDAVRALESADLLPGWYDDWVLFEREQLRQLRMHALEALARKLAVAGRHGEAVQAAYAAVRVEPLRESAHRVVVRVHLAEGNVTEAVRAYENFRALLADELGVRPTAQMEDLVRRIPRRYPAGRGVGV